MKVVKPILAAIVFSSIWGCSSEQEVRPQQAGKLYTQAEIDLLLEQARSEERALVNREINKQEQQKIVFDQLLVKQGKPPKFGTIPVEQTSQVNRVSKITPNSRKPVLYKTVSGIEYYRCAANSLLPIKGDQGGWRYTNDRRELSATLCKKSRDKKTMLALQSFLYDKGYLKSDTLTKSQLVDGIWGETTLVAVKAYQKENGLLFGQMSIETLEHIGIFESEVTIQDSALQNIVKVDVDKVETAENSENQISVTNGTEIYAINTSKKQLASNQENEQSLAPTNQVASLAPELEQIAQPKKTELPAENLTEQVVEKSVENPVKQVVAHSESQEQNSNKSTRVVKIIPENREMVFYQTVSGANYYRCAANSYIAEAKDDGTWDYSKKQQELSATLCKKSRDQATMTDLQYELHEKGFMPANGMPIGQLISGSWDKATLEAVKRYQAAHGLLYGQLTIETLEHLGIFQPTEDRIVAKTEVTSEKQVENYVETDGQQMAQNTAGVDDSNKSVLKENNNQKDRQEQKLESEKNRVPFVPLKVRLADSNIDFSNYVPNDRNPAVYAYVNRFKLWRCRARSIMPEAESDEVYGNTKQYTATLCKKNRSVKLISRLQTALRDAGYLKAREPDGQIVIDGIWGEQTLDAVKQFQKDNKLPYGQLTIQTLEQLGVFVTE